MYSNEGQTEEVEKQIWRHSTPDRYGVAGPAVSTPMLVNGWSRLWVALLMVDEGVVAMGGWV